MGTGHHMARILKQGTKGCMGGGRGEEWREQLHLQSAEKDSHTENKEHGGGGCGECRTEKGLIFYSYYLIVPCNIPIIKDCNN